jgi:hypothetical protein
MEQLSSCYFCGEALDASLDEYPLVPDSLAPAGGDRQTIVLCPTCKRKLDPVVEVVANAVVNADVSPDPSAADDDVVVADSDEGGVDAMDGSEPGGADAMDGSEFGGADTSTDVADDSDGTDVGSSSIIDATPSEEDDSFDGDPVDNAADSRSSSQSDIGSTLGDDEDVLRPVGGDSTGTDGRATGGDRADAAVGSSDSADSDAPTTGDDRVRSDEESSAESSTARTEPRERTYTSGQRAGGRPTDQDRNGNDGSGDDGDDGDDGSDGSDGSQSDRDITLSRLENTNVMRLLQNREFPVERDDFVVVASSAYEVPPRHCEKVIDLAVKHDLLREDDGELHAGSNWS